MSARPTPGVCRWCGDQCPELDWECVECAEPAEPAGRRLFIYHRESGAVVPAGECDVIALSDSIADCLTGDDYFDDELVTGLPASDLIGALVAAGFCAVCGGTSCEVDACHGFGGAS